MARKKRGGERIEPTFDVETEGRGAPRIDVESRGSRWRGGGKRAGKGGKEPRARKRSLIGRLVYWSFVLFIWGVIGVGGVFVYYGSQLPHIDQLAIPKRPPNIAILGADGTLLANRGDTGGAAVRLQDLPPYLPAAFIAIEDRRFYSHGGIDPIGILRALVNDVLDRGAVQGGSTLTQQLAKNLFLTQKRTFSRKIQEAILALWLEHKYSKDKILELYLNRVYFGSGAYGVDAAAEKYFGHSAKDVTLPEAAMLAGLMKAPSKLAPNHNESAAVARADEVIAAMAKQGRITEAMAKVALAHPAHAVKPKAGGSLNYAADYVMDELDKTIGAINEDIVVTSTIKPAMQSAAERAFVGVLKREGPKYRVSQGALVSMDRTGAIRAMIGGRSYADSQFNRAVLARRQPGSAFKPFVYLTALEEGLTPDSVRDDAPINLHGWRPENAEHKYMGPVDLTTALALSLNTVAVRLGIEVGPRAVVRTARRLGITSDLQANASIALGTSDVTPLELVSAYVPFANGGIGVQPYIITKVRTANGKLLYSRAGSSRGRVIRPEYVAMMNFMLEKTLTIGTARRASLPGWEAAGKTGTSQDYRDAWFVGYTSQLVTGVWLGNDDDSPTKHVSGGNLPVEIWSRYMRRALKGVQIVGLPTGGWRSESLFGGLANSLWPHSASPTDARRSRALHTDAGNPVAPATMSGAGQPAAERPQREDNPVPPGSIPDAPTRRWRDAHHHRNFFERLLGL